MENVRSVSMITSVGEIWVVWNPREKASQVLRVLLLENDHDGSLPFDPTHSGSTAQLPEDIEYFCLKIKKFMKGVPVEFSLKAMNMGVCSAFQRKVYMQTRRIPRGRVMSYGHLAEAIGIPKGARAVGTALSKNPFPLIIPCHRVVQNTGDPGGFEGGLKLKRTLLEMEGVTFGLKGRVSKDHFLDCLFTARLSR